MAVVDTDRPAAMVTRWAPPPEFPLFVAGIQGSTPLPMSVLSKRSTEFAATTRRGGSSQLPRRETRGHPEPGFPLEEVHGSACAGFFLSGASSTTALLFVNPLSSIEA